MPTITRIAEQKRDANRRSVYLDGAFAFGCGLNVVAKFRLRDGLVLTAEQVADIQAGEVRQECFDAALRSIEHRMHGRAELKRKLMKKEWGEPVVDGGARRPAPGSGTSTTRSSPRRRPDRPPSTSTTAPSGPWPS